MSGRRKGKRAKDDSDAQMPEARTDKKPEAPRSDAEQARAQAKDGPCPWCGELRCEAHADLERRYRKLFG